MKFFRVGMVVALGLLLLAGQLQTNLAWAADPPSDSGTISVTGSVAPKGASITTSLSASPANTTLNQDEEVEFTLRYGSSNPGSFPLVLQAEWGKGQIAGASEPNVDTATYMVGSATKAYGDTSPVINTTARTITWSIASLPGNSGDHEVRFKLKTTDSYTGPLEVQFPVKLKVLSPSGATDRLVEVPYRYQLPVVEATPTSEPTLPPGITPTPIPNAFESIAIRSTGKTSARVLVTTTLPSKVLLNSGVSPANLGISFESSEIDSEHLLYLDNLTAGTTYYFRVLLLSPQGNIPSDIFTFTTAAQTAVDATRKPTAVTFSQQRSVMYSGPTSVENQDEIKPISVVQNSVIDLNLAIPNDQELKSVEVVVRPSSVLGITTEEVDSDDFQSTTTTMTKISASVFVGKLRMPVNPGTYQVISRIEDLYGNLSEEEIGTVKVTQPFTIKNHLNGEPLQGAEVNLFVFNQQTKLYETVSNITTSIQNPAFADEAGVVTLSLPPAKYLAKITLPGYKPQSIEFEVGSQNEAQFPQVGLEPISNFVQRQYDYGFKVLQKESARLMRQYADLVRSHRIFPTMTVVQLLFTLFLLALINFKHSLIISLAHNLEKLPLWFVLGKFMVHNTVRYSIELAIMSNSIFAYFFSQVLSGPQAFSFAIVTAFNLILWLRYLWLIQVERR